MRLVFLFPGSGRYEALDNWVLTLGRYTKHEVLLARRPTECLVGDCVFVLTEARTYPRERIDADLGELFRMSAPVAVLHNNDRPGGVPTPGIYPSFCWTEGGRNRLRDYGAVLLRQPVFPPVVKRHTGQVLLGTFGHVEPKKQTFEMARWAKKAGVPFVAVGPNVLVREYETYLGELASLGCHVRLHNWLHEIEDLAPLVEDISHFLFVLTDSKQGTGGSPTSPRFAGLFNRPVIVVDDEDTFAEDGYCVRPCLRSLEAAGLSGLKSPSYAWSPDAYLDELARQTLAYWGKPCSTAK